MGYDYALVHLKYTIPPAIALTLLYRPLLTRLDVYKICFLITIAVVSTTPWDSYLIRTNIWSYPSNVVIGPKLFDIPLEEVFFFVIQTYNTTLLYLLLSKPTFHPLYLRYEAKSSKWRYYKLIGQLALALSFKRGINLLGKGGEGTYLGLILVWAIPFLLLLWSLAYQFVIGLPLSNTLVPIALPTLYLWAVDTLALQRGTWVIETGTKLGIHLWTGLEIEEAIFFLVTNTLIVFGLIAFDNAIAILNTFPLHYPSVAHLPSPVMLVRALLLPAAAYDTDRLAGLEEAVDRLQRKSRSFYLASGVFQGRLRADLIMLYSYCRVADDLIDNAKSATEARQWIKKLSTFLDHAYKSTDPMARDPNTGVIAQYVVHNFPKRTQSALLQLPTDRLCAQPLYDMLKGFESDLDFGTAKEGVNAAAKPEAACPIKTEEDLDLYAERVAGTVAQLCIDLVLFHYPLDKAVKNREEARKAHPMLYRAGNRMGVALQYTNIARDIKVDAEMGRIYAPAAWLKREKLTAEDMLKHLQGTASAADDTFLDDKIERIRSRLLAEAFYSYEDAMPAIEQLPVEARGGMRVAVESYMEIGRELRRQGRNFKVKRGKATVPKWKRLLVAYRALSR